MNWVGVVLLLLVGLGVLACWWLDRRRDVRPNRADEVDFSIYLYSPKRGRSSRWDE